MDWLEAAGLVSKQPDQADRRLTHVRATETAAGRFREAHGEILLELEGQLKALSPEQLEETIAVLGRLEQILKQATDEGGA